MYLLSKTNLFWDMFRRKADTHFQCTWENIEETCKIDSTWFCGSLHIILSGIKSRTAFSLKWLLKCLQNIPEKKSFNLNKISFRREQDRQNLWTCVGQISWRGILVIKINVLSPDSKSCEKTTARVALVTIFTWKCVYSVFYEVKIGIMC